MIHGIWAGIGMENVMESGMESRLGIGPGIGLGINKIHLSFKQSAPFHIFSVLYFFGFFLQNRHDIIFIDFVFFDSITFIINLKWLIFSIMSKQSYYITLA